MDAARRLERRIAWDASVGGTARCAAGSCCPTLMLGDPAQQHEGRADHRAEPENRCPVCGAAPRPNGTRPRAGVLAPERICADRIGAIEKIVCEFAGKR